jgi:hypothetical protein
MGYATVDRPGEAYMVATYHGWTYPDTTEIIIYHVQQYGARVDSFYHILINLWPERIDYNPVVPHEFSLSAFPNPFNPSTTISFSLPKAGRVSIDVFDVMGRKTDGLLSAPTRIMEAGEHSVVFDGTRLASGIYFARIEAGGFTRTQKIMLLK